MRVLWIFAATSPHPDPLRVSFRSTLPHKYGVRGLAAAAEPYLAATFTASVGKLESSACSVAMVE
jgi:hypothetical protein